MSVQPRLRIALVGDHDPQVTAHQAIPIALQLAAEAVDLTVQAHWLATDSIDAQTDLSAFDGFWCVPASPYRSLEGALRVIRHAREQQHPYLGTCAGFQYAILEYARHVLGWADAEHGEEAPDSPCTVISPLSCSLVEANGSINLLEATRIAKAYGSPRTHEGYHCRYGINPAFETALLDGDLQASGHDDQGDLRAVELKRHPFFVATLFQPERAALQGKVPPLVSAFLTACINQRQ
ncbi:CTP synthase C-terminal region-related (seleno)protein [Pseudomonas gingeri]|uniref:CTP synthase C-terminal region-related (seleno)protein n=1 Tax=Pseudomonas gingeri TaxID=117681 RepID=UPI0015A4B8F4|nr:CTP synthase [Pseudomonas gingeri]NWA01675.1 CTP synthase [Pseudomonas gingeri]NWA13522.1 CTP synthase [Pseudomonas gingeri]NWA53118.1 CTP synthase [Pseudomonas gingeri]NWA96615.1 CTP synthase [Pseudomonas gingeri]NWA99748.1 CTP synthase [Pseudomonas gingeri]